MLFYLVVGCCGEKERGKRPVMTKIAADKSDVVMLTSDNPANEDPCMVHTQYLCIDCLSDKCITVLNFV